MEEKKKYDSSYSIALAILEKMKGGGGSCKLQDATLAVWENGKYEVNPEPGFNGLSKTYVDVNVPTSTAKLTQLKVDTNGNYIPKESDGFNEVIVDVPQKVIGPAQKIEIVSNGRTEIWPQHGEAGIEGASVIVNVPQARLEENKTLDITNNGSYTMTPSQDFDAIKMGTIHVNVPTGGVEYDWSGTGYTSANSNQVDQDDLTRKQAAIDYTKQKYAVWDPSRTSTSGLYRDDHKLVYAPNIDMSNVTNAEGMFAYCRSLTTLPDGFACPLTTNTSYMFNECSSLTTLPDGFSLPEVTNTDSMFKECRSLTTLPDGFACPKTTNTDYMFNECRSLTTLPDGFNCPLTTNTTNMFSGCYLLTALPDGFACPKTTNTDYMFAYCSSLTTLPDGFACPKTTNTEWMFSECRSLTTLPDGFACPLTTNTSYMFYHCSSLTTIPEGFSCPKSTGTYLMFGACKSLKSLPKMDFSSVTDITNFFGHNKINTLTDLGGFTGLKIDWNDGCGLNQCPNLTKQSVLNVINELYDFRSNGDAETTKTIQFHANSLALLSDEEKLIATNKGWNLVG